MWRLTAHFRKTWHTERDAWGFIVLGTKIVFLGSVLVIYSWMFVSEYGDWFAHPGTLQGEVLEKEVVMGPLHYILLIRDGSQTQTLSIDARTYEVLKVGERVKLVFLPERHQVIKCEVLAH